MKPFGLSEEFRLYKLRNIAKNKLQVQLKDDALDKELHSFRLSVWKLMANEPTDIYSHHDLLTAIIYIK